MIHLLMRLVLCNLLCIPALFSMDSKAIVTPSTNQKVAKKVIKPSAKAAKPIVEATQPSEKAVQPALKATQEKKKTDSTVTVKIPHTPLKNNDSKKKTDESSDEETAAEPDAIPASRPPVAHFDSGLRAILTKLITQETKGIWAAFYRCNDTAFITSWAAHMAKNPALKGCLLLNAHEKETTKDESKEAPKKGGKKTKSEHQQEEEALQELNTSKFPIRRVQKLKATPYSEMHNKFILFEGNESGKPVLITGSANATNAAFEYHFENMVVIYNPRIIAHYAAELKAMYDQSIPNNEAAIAMTGWGLQFEAPQPIADKIFPTVAFRSGIKPLILNLISWETSAINGAQFIFTLDEAAKAWSEKQLAGSLVVGQSYKTEIGGLAALRRVHEAGVDLYCISERFQPGWAYYKNVHHKFLIFSNNVGGKSAVLVGSANISKNSLENNWENAFVSDDPSLIRQFQTLQVALTKHKSTTKLTDDDFKIAPLFDDDDWVDN